MSANDDTSVAQSRVPLAAISMAVPAILFGVTAISLPLAAAQSFGLSTRETASLIVALYGIPGVLCIVLSLIYRQPLLIAWHTHGMIFVTAVAIQYSYPQVLGAVLVAGMLVLLSSMLGLTTRLAALIPAPVVFGLVAGTTMPFVVRVFTDLSTNRAVIGATIAGYLLGRLLLPAKFPPLLLALGIGVGMALALGDVNRLPDGWSWPSLTVMTPSFSLPALLSIAPVMAIFIAVQSNVTTVIYLRSQRFDPPERLMNAVTGAGTMLGSLAGIAPIASGSAIVPLVASPEAGEQRQRYWGSVLCGSAWLVVAALAGVAAGIPHAVPLSLLFALAGLAMVGVLQQAIAEVARGPLRLGPLFAFVIASSQLTLLGLGPLFWALVGGMLVSLLLESKELRATRAG